MLTSNARAPAIAAAGLATMAAGRAPALTNPTTAAASADGCTHP